MDTSGLQLRLGQKVTALPDVLDTRKKTLLSTSTGSTPPNSLSSSGTLKMTKEEKREKEKDKADRREKEKAERKERERVEKAERAEMRSKALTSPSMSNIFNLQGASGDGLADTDEYKEEESDDIKFAPFDADDMDGIPRIKAASINKLIERLTHEVYPDIKFRNVFMLTYRSFMDPHQLLQKLDERFHCCTDAKESRLKTIQLRVVGVVKAWIESYTDDFIDDESLNMALVDLINKMGKTMEAPSAQLNHILQKRLDKRSSKCLSAPKVEVTLGSQNGFDWLQMDETEVAQQICVLEFAIYRAISAKETLNLNWSKNKERSPNVLSMIEQFNRVSHPF